MEKQKKFNFLTALKTLRLGIALSAMFTGLASASVDKESAMLEVEIEEKIKAILNNQLAPGDYFVYAKVERTKPNSAADKNKAGREIPYSTLTVDTSYLKKIFEKNNPGVSFEDFKVTVSLTLDERIPKEKQDLLVQVVTDRFGFDGKQRTLVVKTLSLVTPPIGIEKSLGFEKEKLETERSKLSLEIEKSKIELARRQLELEKQAKVDRDKFEVQVQTAKQEVETVKKQAEEKEKKSADNTTVNVVQQSPMGTAKDFQLLMFAVILAVAVLMGVAMSGGVLKKGLGPVSVAIGKVAESMSGSKEGKEGGGVTAAVVGGGAIAAGPAAVAGGAGGQASGGGDHHSENHATFLDTANGTDLNIDKFLDAVQEKIEVLTKEQNFGFYRHLADMIEDDQTLPLAASVLVVLEEASAQALLQGLAPGQIARIRNYLESSGALAKAKLMRRQALQDFYGRIAMDEYLGSPLMKLKDLSWLTKMSNAEISKTILSLPDDEQDAFLATLTPTRVRMVIESTEDATGRGIILARLGSLEQLDANTILQTIAKISKKVREAKAAQKVQGAKVLDSAKYIAMVAEDLDAQDRDRLFGSLNNDPELLNRISEFYVPFATVLKLPKPLLLEVFASRANNQIALILYAASKEIRDLVMKNLPEIRASSIEDELKLLEMDKIYTKRNRRASLDLQKEISKFLLKMSKEGLFTVGNSKTGAMGASNAA
jgi:hypothetical protein